VATDVFDQGIITRVERALALRDELQAEQARLRGCGDTREYELSSNRQGRNDPRSGWSGA